MSLTRDNQMLKRILSLRALAVARLPSHTAEGSTFADQFNAKQNAENPDGYDRGVGPKIKRQQNSDYSAGKNPGPVWKRPDCQRKNHLGNALNHKEHNQQERESQQTGFRITQEENPNHDGQNDRHKLKPEMRHVASVNEADRLQYAADDQEPAKEGDNCNRRYGGKNQSKDASEDHESALYKIPERVPLYLFAHCLPYDLGGGFD